MKASIPVGLEASALRGWLILLLCSFVGTAHAQTNKKLAARIDAVMAPFARKDGPGCAVALVQQGKVVHARGYGMADLERGVPITPDSVFDVGANSKQFTAAGIYLLAAEGKLDVDADVRKYLPELPAYNKTITVRHLLTHTSGLRDYTRLLPLAGRSMEDAVADTEMFALIQRLQTLELAPGERFAYSNTNYFLLGRIIEKISGQTYTSFLQKRIFGPLGMTRSTVNDDANKIVKGRALGYSAGKSGGYRTQICPWVSAGDGGLLTTVLDLARWDDNFYRPKVGDAALIKALEQPGKLNDGSRSEFASGLVIREHRGLKLVDHGGSWPGYGSQISRFPDQQITSIVLCNAPDADAAGLSLRIAELALDKKLGPEKSPVSSQILAKVTLSAEQLDTWVGSYIDWKSGELLVVTRTGDQLTIQRGGGSPYTLTALNERSFELTAFPDLGEFRFDGVAPNRKLEDPKYGMRDEYRPRAVPAATLRDYAGTYHSDELDVDWTIRVDGIVLEFKKGKDDGFNLRGEEPQLRFKRVRKPK